MPFRIDWSSVTTVRQKRQDEPLGAALSGCDVSLETSESPAANHPQAAPQNQHGVGLACSCVQTLQNKADLGGHKKQQRSCQFNEVIVHLQLKISTISSPPWRLAAREVQSLLRPACGVKQVSGGLIQHIQFESEELCSHHSFAKISPSASCTGTGHVHVSWQVAGACKLTCPSSESSHNCTEATAVVQICVWAPELFSHHPVQRAAFKYLAAIGFSRSSVETVSPS